MNRLILPIILLLCASGVGYSQTFKQDNAVKPQSDLWIEASKSKKTVEFVNDGSVVSLQFELTLEGLTENQVSCQDSFTSDHVMVCFYKDGYLKAAVYSITNSAVPDTTLLTIDGNSAGASYLRGSKSSRKNANIRAIKFNDITAANVTPDHLKR